jgi:Fe-Mn family superoxide dismutase
MKEGIKMKCTIYKKVFRSLCMILALLMLPIAQLKAAPIPEGPFKLPPLPYAYDALEPFIDTQTMTIHHQKHHATYVQKLNEAINKYPELRNKSHVELLRNIDKRMQLEIMVAAIIIIASSGL